jgi:hypothetical protein
VAEKVQRKIAKIMANQSKFQAEADSSQEVSIKKRCYKCIMPGCNYTAPNGFFKWPKKEYLKKKWEKIRGLENVSENAKVCTPHFHPDHIIKRSQTETFPRLKLGAVPMLNLPKVRE